MTWADGTSQWRIHTDEQKSLLRRHRLLYSAMPSNRSYLHAETPRRNPSILDQPNSTRCRRADGDSKDHAGVDEEALFEETCSVRSQ